MPVAVPGPAGVISPARAPSRRVPAGPPPARDARPRRTPRGRLRRWLPLLGLSALAALVSVALHTGLFSGGSLNNDDAVYLLQAKALAHGHLFLPVPAPAKAYQPWFFAITDHGYVSKYLPLVSAVFAVGLLLTGSVAPVLALLAAALPLLVAALGREVGLSPPRALAAAALVSASPVVVVQSGLALSYLLFAVLLLACWLLLLRLARGAAGWRSAVALGLLASAAACCRPYDAVLLLLAPAAFVGSRLRAERRRLAGLVVATGLGVAPLVAAVLAYDVAATGSAMRLPFGLLEPADTFGFGTRRLVPEDPDRHFGIGDGLTGLLLHFGRLPLTWFALGAVLVPAAVVAGRRAAAPTRVLLAAAATLTGGYLVFWGPWLATVLWGGPHVIGPFYALPALVPVVLGGLPPLLALARRHPRPFVAAVLIAVAASGTQLGVALARTKRDAARTARILAAVARVPAGQLLLAADPPYLGHPVSALVNDRPGDLDGTDPLPRYALAAALPVPAPGEPLPALLQIPDDAYSGDRLALSLTTTVRAQGARVPLEVAYLDDPARRTRVEGGTGHSADPPLTADPRRELHDVLVVERGGVPSACLLDPGPSAGGAPGRRVAALTLTQDGVRGCSGVRIPTGWRTDRTRHCPDAGCLAVAIYRADAVGRGLRLQWRRLPVATAGGQVALLTDGATLERSGTGWIEVRAPGA